MPERGDSFAFPSLVIKAYLPNSRQFPHDLTLIQFAFAIAPYIEDMQDDTMRHWLQTVLREFEMHELNEWFRVDGELVNDPHATQDGR